MMIPSTVATNGNLPEKRQKEIIRAIVRSVQGSSKQRERFLYDFYEGKFNASTMSYLTEVAETDEDSENYGMKYQFPAKIRFINMLKPKLESLNSPLILSPDSFKVIAVDKGTIKKKLDNRIKNTIKMIDNKIAGMIAELQIIKQQLEQKNMSIQQMLSKEPESEDEAKKQQQLRDILPIVNGEMSLLERSIKINLSLTNEEQEKLERYYKYDAAELAEEYMQKGMTLFFKMNSFKSEELKAFKDKKITGKEFYFVDLEEGQRWPMFKRLSLMEFDYSGDESEEHVQHCSWQCISKKMSAAQILDEFKDELSASKIALLEKQCGVVGTDQEGNFVPVGFTGALDTGYQEGYGGDFYTGSTSTQMYDVYYVYYKVQRDVHIKYSPNKNSPGDMFRHFINDDEKNKWMNNKEKREAKGEKIKTLKGLNHIYQGIMIGRDTFVRLGMKKWQLRDENFRPLLPGVGYSYNRSEDRPSSLVWMAKDIQILLNIIHYHEELMLAIAGTKTMVLDHAQKPGFMTNKEWYYNVKMGMMHIDSMPGGRRASFNQFNSFDNSVAASIQYLDNIKKSLNSDLSYITGVPREMEGQTVATDQVGTYQMAIQRGNMRNLLLFFEHEEVFRMAIKQYVNLLSISWAEGDYINYIDTDVGHYPLEIPKGIFDDVIYDVIPVNRAKILQDFDEIKAMAMNYAKTGQMPFDKLLEIYNTDSLEELIKKYGAFYQKATEIQALNAQQSEESKKQAEKELKAFEREYDMVIEKQNNKIAQANILLDEKKLALEEQKIAIDARLKAAELQIKAMDIDSEREVESHMLKETERSNKFNEGLNLIRLLTDVVLNKDSNDKKHKEAIEKLKVESKKIAGSKNHINNN